MPTNGTEDGLLRQHLNLAANSLLDRASLVQSLLGDTKDIDRDCGYPKGVVPRELYQELYDREPIAARVVEVYPKECWQVQPSVYEDEDSETETAFEAAWSGLATSVRAEKSYHQDEQGSVLWEYLYRADVLSGIGHYGIILLGIDDGKDLAEPADMVAGSVSDEVTLAPEGTPWTPLPGTPEAGPIGETGPRLGKGSADSAAYTKGARTAGFANGKNRTWSWNQSGGNGGSKKGPKRKLTFLRVFPESMAWIDQFDSNPSSPRFGQPVRYTLLFNDPAAQAAGIGLQMITAPVHWTRVLHIADNLASSEVFGVPRMQAVLNRLLDIRKIHGGSAEMYWRGAFPGYSLETLPQLGTEVDIDTEGVKKMMWDWANGLQRHVVLTGLTMKSLSPQVTDPSPQVNTQIEAICIKLGVPVRIFKGSERGELASSQDDAAWNDRLKQRQSGYVTPRLIVPFVDRLVALGVLPAPEGYSVWWPDLTSKSDQEKAAIAAQRTTGLVAYGASAPTQDIITPTDYLIKIQGFDEAEAQSVVENAQAEKDKREKEQAKQQADQLKQQQDQAEAEHQRQLELAAAKGPQEPPPGGGGDGSGNPGTDGVPPTSPAGSPGGNNVADTAAGVQNYDPDQPREPAGTSGGGQFAKDTGSGAGGKGDRKATREEKESAYREKAARVRAKLGEERIAAVKGIVADLLPNYQHVNLYGRMVKSFDPAVPEHALVAEMMKRGLSDQRGTGLKAYKILDAMTFAGELTRRETGAGDPVLPGRTAVSYSLPRHATGQTTLEGGRESLSNAAKAELTGGRWATIEGVHVYIKSGKVVAGPAALEGHPPSDLKSIRRDAYKSETKAEAATHKAEVGGSSGDHVLAMRHHADAAHLHSLAAQHPDNKTPEDSKDRAEAASTKATHHAVEAGHGDLVKHLERDRAPKATEPQELKAGASKDAEAKQTGKQAPAVPPAAGKFGTTKDVTWSTPEKEVERHAKRILGPGATAHDLLSCAGIPDGATVEVQRVGPTQVKITARGSVSVKDPKTGKDVEQPYVAARTVRSDRGGDKYVINTRFDGKGSGLAMFGRQIENASKWGISRIKTDASGEGSGVTGKRDPKAVFNGYYTWPRFGYDAPVESATVSRLPPNLRKDVDAAGGRVSGLMATQEGRDWWLGHGHELKGATFDLTSGSYSRETFAAYLRHRDKTK